MQFKQYTNVNDFYHATYTTLMCHEAQNMIPLGNLIIGHEGKDKNGWRDPANWYMATVEDNSGILLTAIMTPPHNIAIYATDNKISAEAIGVLVDGIADHPIPGVIAEKSLAECFAKAYTSRKGMKFEVASDQRIYELTEVNHPATIGKIRLLEEKDISFFPYWMNAAHAEFAAVGATTMEIPLDAEDCIYKIGKKNLYCLEVDGVPVSFAGLNREMQNVIGVGPVYTPSYFRGRGYASSCVAQISQLALDRGFEKCVLYTNLANPTSNSIYQRMGYRAIADSLMLKFV